VSVDGEGGVWVFLPDGRSHYFDLSWATSEEEGAEYMENVLSDIMPGKFVRVHVYNLQGPDLAVRVGVQEAPPDWWVRREVG